MRRAAVALLVVVAFAGCRKQQTSEDNRARMNPVVPPSQDMPSKRVGGVSPVQTRIDLDEYDVKMPDTLKAGPQSFLVANAGTTNHSLAIEGNGVDVALPQPLPRGDTTTLNVDLKPGTYTFYCPVDNHKNRGMSRTVTVE